MNGETKTKIAKMLYHLSNDNRASADKELHEILKIKAKNAFAKEYEKVKRTFSKENDGNI